MDIDKIEKYGIIAKPIIEFLSKIAFRIIEKDKDTIKILDKLAKEEGRIDFSPEHVKLIKIINDSLQHGDSSTDIDNVSFFEILEITKKEIERLEEENFKNFKNSIILSLKTRLSTIDGCNKDTDYINYVSNIAFENIDNIFKKNTMKNNYNYPYCVNYKIMNNLEKKEEYNKFYNSFFESANNESINLFSILMVSVDSVYSDDKKTFEAFINGFGGVVNNNEILNKLFASTLLPDNRLKITEKIGVDTISVEISKDILSVEKIILDLRPTKFVFSGILSSILAFCKILDMQNNMFTNKKAEMILRINKNQKSEVTLTAPFVNRYLKLEEME